MSFLTVNTSLITGFFRFFVVVQMGILCFQNNYQILWRKCLPAAPVAELAAPGDTTGNPVALAALAAPAKGRKRKPPPYSHHLGQVV
jgi:hypothetical protein